MTKTAFTPFRPSATLQLWSIICLLCWTFYQYAVQMCHTSTGWLPSNMQNTSMYFFSGKQGHSNTNRCMHSASIGSCHPLVLSNFRFHENKLPNKPRSAFICSGQRTANSAHSLQRLTAPAPRNTSRRSVMQGPYFIRQLSAVTFRRAWADSWVDYVNTINEPTGSKNR